MPFFASPWQGIATDLDNEYSEEYLYHQSFRNDNFLASLVPQNNTFFGTKVLNIFIAQRAYGWRECGNPINREFVWPPEGFQDSLDLYLATRERFASYTTMIWVDYWTAVRNQSFYPGSDWLMMMDQTNDAIQEFCSTTPGFQYMGKIESQVEASFFHSYIDDFYGTPSYKSG